MEIECSGNFDFSVLVSVYFKENSDFLERALRSIAEQTYLPKQLVIVEDGQLTKALNRVVDTFDIPGCEITIVKIKKNSGLANALNVGLLHCKYDLVARMDSDDISERDRFEIEFNYCENHPECVIVGSQLVEFEGRSDVIVGRRTVPTTSEKIKKFAIYRSPFNHPTVMYRAEVIKKLGGYDGFDFLEDYALWVKVICGGYKVANVSKSLLRMRVGNGLYSRRGGLAYLSNYFRLRNYFRTIGFLNSWQCIVGDVIMSINIILPPHARRRVYQLVIHRR